MLPYIPPKLKFSLQKLIIVTAKVKFMSAKGGITRPKEEFMAEMDGL